MITQELINEIATLVLDRLRTEVPQAFCKHEPFSANNDKIVLVLVPRNEELLSCITQKIDQQTRIVFLDEGFSVNDSRIARYIVPEISCCDMASLANGRGEGDLGHTILRLLLAGKKVEVLSYLYKNYADSAPSALFDMYRCYEKKLCSYGLVPFEAKKPEAVRVHDLLLTEKTVVQASEAGAKIILAPAGAVITPLAHETAVGLNILIQTGA